MRVLLDISVLIAAFIARGACSELLEHCVRNHVIVTSPGLLRELEEKLGGKLAFTREETSAVLSLLRSRVELTAPEPPGMSVCRDPDDDQVLAAALAGKCDCIVTGDKDLLTLGRFRDIPILTPADFWRYERL